MKPLRLVFCGHNRTGALVLKELLAHSDYYQVVWVWTIAELHSEIEEGRSVSELAAARGIPVFIGDPRQELRTDDVRALTPDLIVCSNYRYLLPLALYKSARLGAINVHGSLLPHYRGRMPNCWAIINGDAFTGVTVHRIDEGIDTGPILAQERIAIDWRDTGATLVSKQIARCPLLVLKGIENLLDPAFRPHQQSSTEGSWFPKRRPLDGLVEWSWSARKIYDWVRAQTHPYAGAFTTHHGTHLIVWKAAYSELPWSPSTQATPGTILGSLVSPELSGVWVATGAEPIVLTNVQYHNRPSGCPYDLFLTEEWKVGDRLGT